MTLWGRSKKKKSEVPHLISSPRNLSSSTYQLPQTMRPQRPPQLPLRPEIPLQCWTSTLQDSTQYQQPYQPIYVSNYYIHPSQSQMQLSHIPGRPYEKQNKGRLLSASVSNLPNLLGGDVPECLPGAQYFNDGISSWQRQGTQALNQSAALYDQISSKFNDILTLIDGDQFSGDERDLWLNHPHGPQWQEPAPRLQVEKKLRDKNSWSRLDKGADDGCPITAVVVNSNYFAKVNMYANSRLPADLPQVKLYLATFPLLCLAAQYSEKVYSKPTGKEREAHVNADWKNGTKAMVIKSVPKDDMNIIVFAIRGSQTFLDWAVNLNSAPASPQGFLDDPGNFCHSGFLSVARKMIAPVAARLRQLLIDNPNRRASSLLITGHSAGGAVAALLYSHMLSTSTASQSELNDLTRYFKRIHCITFGAPPISLLPLQKPDTFALRKSLFLSFVNEGDPVVRADKEYVKSLLDLYSRPAPNPGALKAVKYKASKSTINLGQQQDLHLPTWRVPPSTLSNAGRIILLRAVSRVPAGRRRKESIEMMDDGVQARAVTDELLRGVIWGDPVCHMMKLYARRIEVLATNAVVGKS